MGRCLFALVGLVIFASGCATLSNRQDLERIASLEDRVTQLKVENKALKDKTVVLKDKTVALEDKITVLEEALAAETKKEKLVFKMPNAKEIQTALKNTGYYKGEIDGDIGSQTKEAIRKFQEANDLNPDGVIGSRTWEKLSVYLEPKPPVSAEVNPAPVVSEGVSKAAEEKVAQPAGKEISNTPLEGSPKEDYKKTE